MRERPIIFSAPMVRAILSGRKTQTRQVIKPQPEWSEPHNCWMRRAGRSTWDTNLRRKEVTNTVTGSTSASEYALPAEEWLMELSPFTVGDRLWVRENLRLYVNLRECYEDIMYASDGAQVVADWPEEYISDMHGQWVDVADDGRQLTVPSIHMPRWASRITLEIEDVRVMRLRDISEDDAVAEGFERERANESPEVWLDARDGFLQLWDEINGDEWRSESNPWVWAITFKRVKQDGAK